MAVSDVIKAIRRAKANDNIKGIYLEAGSLSTGFAGIEAIRRELVDFKDSGKFIVSYGDFIRRVLTTCVVWPTLFF